MRTITHPGGITEIAEDGVVLRNGQDVLDVLLGELGANAVILTRANLAPEFFDLRTGVAGDIAQKLANYRLRLGVIGDFSDCSPNFQAFAGESNKGKTLFFVRDAEEGRGYLR